MLRWIMEKEKDMGLRYLMELGIRPARDKKGMYTQLKKQLGQREADRLMEQVWQESDVQRLYDVKNESYEKESPFPALMTAIFIGRPVIGLPRIRMCLVKLF